MRLERLAITNFKNIQQAELEFSPGVNCLLGDNGMGKSNLLDAIWMMSFCRSFTGLTDAQLVSRGEDFAMISAHYTRRGVAEELTAGFRAGRRKSFKRSGKEYQRLSAHIGLFPAVLISPSDATLVSGTSEERRRLLDMVISQADASYLEALIRYNKALEQRNRMLRDEATDAGLYAAVELQMEMAATVVSRAREAYVKNMADKLVEYYSIISGGAEVPSLSYSPGLRPEAKSLADYLAATRQRDMILHYTTSGPHRDDVEMVLDDMPVRRVASQGQSKSFTIALRLAQYDFLRQSTSIEPLLLLDDIFDRLDAGRVERIMRLVTSDRFGQTFITDTNRRHLDEIVTQAGDNYRMWLVDHGKFTPIEQ